MASPYIPEPQLSAGDWRALRWSTAAGLATAIGGAPLLSRCPSPLTRPPRPPGGLAVIRRPVVGGALLAFLLGCAIGVMATLSVLELLVANALENGVWQVSEAAAAAAAKRRAVPPLRFGLCRLAVVAAPG